MQQSIFKNGQVFLLYLKKNAEDMLTLNTIIKEIKNIPVSRLEDLYQLVHSMSLSNKQTESLRKKILSYGGAFSDMSSEDYADFLNHTKKARTILFDRKIEL